MEILVGDDSPEDCNGELIAKLDSAGTIQHFRNSPSLGQARNVESLIEKATGDLICLVHDDDTLQKEALELLLPVHLSDPDVLVSFGKQYLMSHHGVVDKKSSQKINAQFRRTEATVGMQPDVVKSALMQQFPNNAYLIKAACAKKIKYGSLTEKYGDACDYGFALECALAFPNMKACFVNEYTASYRLSETSVSSGAANDAAFYSFQVAQGIAQENYSKDAEVTSFLEEKAPIAIGCALNNGKREVAKDWLFSPYHRKRLLSPGGVKRLLRTYI